MLENEQRLYLFKEKKVVSKKIIHKKIKTIKTIKILKHNNKNKNKNETNPIKKDLNSPFAILQKLL